MEVDPAAAAVLELSLRLSALYVAGEDDITGVRPLDRVLYSADVDGVARVL